MAVRAIQERSEKITISIPASLLATVDELARERKSSRSAIIAELVRKLAQEKLEEELREGYLANAEFAKELAEADLEAGNEVWSEW